MMQWWESTPNDADTIHSDGNETQDIIELAKNGRLYKVKLIESYDYNLTLK